MNITLESKHLAFIREAIKKAERENVEDIELRICADDIEIETMSLVGRCTKAWSSCFYTKKKNRSQSK